MQGPDAPSLVPRLSLPPLRQLFLTNDLNETGLRSIDPLF